jgi:rhodanese-related sulfurtransferase
MTTEIINRNLTPDEFEKFISQPGVHLLDIREGYEYAGGHLENAKLVPTSNFWAHFDELGLKKDDKIALYCHTGSRSSYVLNNLLEAGYTGVVHLQRGIVDWYGQGKKVVG